CHSSPLCQNLIHQMLPLQMFLEFQVNYLPRLLHPQMSSWNGTHLEMMVDEHLRFTLWRSVLKTTL
ncbi:hypothetical protein T265_16284, partial [Opisthorchis viverrini]